MEMHDGDINWKDEAPCLMAVRSGTPYGVPEGYFDQSQLHIRTSVVVESFRFENEKEFPVPSSYFNELSDQINSLVSLEKLKDDSGNAGFQVPAGYFEGLDKKVASSIKEPALPRRTSKGLLPVWLKMAAAACTTVILGSVIYFNSDYYSLNRELAKIPDQEIINYLQVHSTMSDTPFIIEQLSAEQLQDVNSEISNEDLELYLDNTTL